MNKSLNVTKTATVIPIALLAAVHDSAWKINDSTAVELLRLSFYRVDLQVKILCYAKTNRFSVLNFTKSALCTK